MVSLYFMNNAAHEAALLCSGSRQRRSVIICTDIQMMIYCQPHIGITQSAGAQYNTEISLMSEKCISYDAEAQ